MIAAIYARVSTATQHTENQLPELHEFAGRNKWETVEYIEHASAKAGSKRPVLAQLLADAKEGKFQVVLVLRIDRFGRSLVDFLQHVRKLNDLGIRFIATSQMIDTDKHSPVGTLIMQVLAVIAEFERALIVERIREGVSEYEAAVEAGTYGVTRHSKSGKDKPRGRPVKIFHRARALEMRAAGMSFRKIGEALGVHFNTVALACKAAKA